MTDLDLISRLAVSLAIGLLLGLERGWRDRLEPAGHRTAGVRTFSLLGLLGGVTATLTESLGAPVFGMVLLVTGAALGLFMFWQAVHEQDFSATSLIAALLTFVLGGLAAVGETHAAAASAVAATVLLAWKEPLHSWLSRLTWPELKSGLVLATMTFILLPLLPARTVDPWDAINPYQLWLMTILIAVVSFVGYAAITLAGPRHGPVLAAIAGGSVASTATTLTFARLAKSNPGRERLLAASIVLAGCTMMLRVMIVVGIINTRLLSIIGLPLALAATVGGLFAWWALPPQDSTEAAGVRFENPFELAEVLKFGVLLAAILVATQVIRAAYGDVGMLGLAALSGIADADAITLATASLSKLEIQPETAGLVILTAVLANTLTKVVLATWAGGRKLGALVLVGMSLTCSVGALIFLLQRS
jgi:uncharacterized membrane protein (DUF4010 family)